MQLVRMLSRGMVRGAPSYGANFLAFERGAM